MIMIMIVLLFSVLAPFLYGIYPQEVLNEPFGDNLMSTEVLIVTGISSLLIMGLIIVVFKFLKLKTKITTDGIMVSFPPLKSKWEKYTPGEIEKYEVRVYKAIREYGGYGIKRGLKKGQSYTISGNIGLQLYLKNGKKLLIGTQKKQAIKYAMDKLMRQDNSGQNG